MTNIEKKIARIFWTFIGIAVFGFILTMGAFLFSNNFGLCVVGLVIFALGMSMSFMETMILEIVHDEQKKQEDEEDEEDENPFSVPSSDYDIRVIPRDERDRGILPTSIYGFGRVPNKDDIICIQSRSSDDKIEYTNWRVDEIIHQATVIDGICKCMFQGGMETSNLYFVLSRVEEDES